MVAIQVLFSVLRNQAGGGSMAGSFSLSLFVVRGDRGEIFFVLPVFTHRAGGTGCGLKKPC